VASLYVAALLDIVVAWALFTVFRPVDAELSRLSAWFRLAYAAVFIGGGFYRTCVIDGLLEHSPADHIRRPRRRANRLLADDR